MSVDMFWTSTDELMTGYWIAAADVWCAAAYIS
jgi:hypothetical protein